MPSEMLPFLVCILMFAIGVYAVVGKKNLIKVIIGVMIIEYSVNLFLLMVGYRVYPDGARTLAGTPPILAREVASAPADVKDFIARRCVDPIPQALILTSIVIGLGTVALMVAIALRIYEKYGTFDITQIRRLRG